MKPTTILVFLGLLAIAALAVVACQPQVEQVIQTVVITEIVEPVREQVVVTQIVEVTPVPEETGPVEFKSADPTTYNYAAIGDPVSFDTGLAYDKASGHVLQQTYETLVWYKRNDPNDIIPSLAESWEVSDDGKVYTFQLHEGVTFHTGETMTAEDVAYTFQRGLLQGGSFSLQSLLTEPFFGVGILEITELVDPSRALVDNPFALQVADPDALLAACERVMGAIVADNDAGTVTMTLAQPWAPFLQTLAGFWGSINNKAWNIEQGAWDGDCATWQNYYGVNDLTAPMTSVINGTGPYRLESWTPGEGWVLVANENYWRTCDIGPLWEGGHCGPPAMQRIVKKTVDEWSTRFAMVQAGEADHFTVDVQFASQLEPLVGEQCDYNSATLDFECVVVEDNPDGPLRLYVGHPLASRNDAMFTFDINTEGGNPFIGSGTLDGNGIPPDFFSDVHVRKAFNYCFDWDIYIREALIGEGVQNYGVIIPGMLGYNPDDLHYSFDLEQCQAEIEQAWDGAVAENGFRLQLAFNTGNITRQAVSRQIVTEILQTNFRKVDPKYNIEIIGLPWPSYLNAVLASRLPISMSGWIGDIHDPHNWVQPFTAGTYAVRQMFPEALKGRFLEYVNSGVATIDKAERQRIYEELNQLDYDQAPAIRLAVSTGRHYEQRWVDDWFFNPILSQPYSYYYAMSKR